MSLLNYAHYTSVAGHKDVLAKIKTFAVDQGWILDDYRTNVEWGSDGGGGYEWNSGTGDFCQLYSTGYGAQNIIVRLFAWENGSDPQSEYLDITGTSPSWRNVDSADSHNPVHQHYYCSHYGLSMLPTTIPEMYVFGNSKMIFAVVRMDTLFSWQIYFGTIELFDPAETEVMVVDNSWKSRYDYGGKWYNIAGNSNYSGRVSCVIDRDYETYNNWYHDGGGKNWDRVWLNVYDYGGALTGNFSKLHRAVQLNNFTGKRPLIKTTVFIRRNSDGVILPVGVFPMYHLVYTGLQFGEVLTYGTEQYIAVPNTFQSRKYGLAVRVA